jgi:hypothetical protein
MTASRRVSIVEFGLIPHTNHGLISFSYSNIRQSSLHKSLYLVSLLHRDAVITVWRRNDCGSRLLCSSLCFVPSLQLTIDSLVRGLESQSNYWSHQVDPLPPDHWILMSNYQSYFESIVYTYCDYHSTCGEIE